MVTVEISDGEGADIVEAGGGIRTEGRSDKFPTLPAALKGS